MSALPTYAEGLPLCGKRRYLLLSILKTYPPHLLQGFLVLAESKERTLQFACPRALPEETRHFHPVECAVISYSLSYKPIPCIFAGFFVRWRRVRKELFSSRVGSADIRRGSPALRETALSLTLNTQNLSPAFYAGFLCVGGEQGKNSLVRVSAVSRHTPRVSRLAGNGVISYFQYSKPIPPHKMRDFCALAGKHPPKSHLKFIPKFYVRKLNSG